ncbi:MAG: sensor histidine kinase [Cellulosilyticaceae bacterium]
MRDVKYKLRWCRYSSLILTSCFYISVERHHTIMMKLMIVMALSLAARLIQILLEGLSLEDEGDKRIGQIAIVELIGNSFIILVSGGLSSPYMWYCMNTILLVAVYKSPKWSYGVGLFYLVIGVVGSVIELMIVPVGNIEMSIQLVLNSALGIGLIIIAVHVLGTILKKVEQQAEALSDANTYLKSEQQKTEQTLKDIVAMYGVVDTLVLESQQSHFSQALVRCVQTTGISDKVMILTFETEEVIEIGVAQRTKEKLYREMMKHARDLGGHESIAVYGEEQRYILKSIHYGQKVYGMMAVQQDSDEEMFINYKLDFLLKLAGMVFKKLELEDISQDFIISEERNRIANEIHDTVIQKLFASSCAMHLLSQQIARQTPDEISQEITFIRGSIQQTMEELRLTIYNLSWEKDSRDSFVEKIESYLASMRLHHQTHIALELAERDLLLTTQEKVAIYRMICELVNNAIRHGKADHIGVNMGRRDEKICIEVQDDGCGFDYKKVRKENKQGMGLKNIERLVSILEGEIKWEKTLPQGVKAVILIGQKKRGIGYGDFGSR